MKRAVLERHLLREMAWPTLAALALLFQLMVALQLLRRVDVLLGSAVHGRDVLELLVALLPHYLVLCLPMSVLLGTLIGLGQLAEDRELDALASAGVSPLRLLRAPALLAGGAMLLVFGLALGPESRGLLRVRQKFDELLKLQVQRDVRPGIFYDEVQGLTLFAESIDPRTGAWRHVMVDDERDPRAPLLILADSGGVKAGERDEALSLQLGRGQGHRQQVGGDDYTALSFQQATLTIAVEDSLLRKNTLRSYDDEKSLGELWAESGLVSADGQASRVALHRRLGLVFSVLAFIWLAVPVALWPSSSAGARSRGYVVAALSVVGYFVLLRIGSTLGQSGRADPVISGQLANAVFLAVGSAVWWRIGRRV